MALQNKAGTIILDATLTDVGRRHLANGKFEITKFSLGDDEISYTEGTTGGGEYEIRTAPVTFEAITDPSSALIHGLMDIGSRNDVFYMPEYLLNTKIKNAVKPYENYIYLSVNQETTEKISTAIKFNDHILENESESSNMVVFECGIAPFAEDKPIDGTQASKERYLYNLKLHDDYVFVYADSRLFENIMSAPMQETSVFMKNLSDDPTSPLYTATSTIQPLQIYHKNSLPSPADNYDTYYCKTSYNNIYDGVSGVPVTNFTMFYGPRSCFVGLNFVVNPKMKSKSNGAADVRYTKFGKTAQNLFSDGNLYDYVDTNIMIEGASSLKTKTAKVRIIRFSGT